MTVKNKSMDFKKLEKATLLYEKIKLLDADIIELDKMALVAADGDKKFKISISYEKVDKEKVKIEEDDDSMIGMLAHMQRRLSYSMCSPAPKNTVKYKKEASENTVLNVLAVLLIEKKTERERHLKTVSKLIQP